MTSLQVFVALSENFQNGFTVYTLKLILLHNQQTAVLLTTLDSQKIYHFNFQALKDLDFEVRDRLFLESVMDIEFQDSNVSEKAIFYKGTPIINSHALSFYKSKNIFGRSKVFWTSPNSFWHESKFEI